MPNHSKDYDFENVWENQNAATTDELKQFWLAENAIHREAITAERLKQVIFLARHHDGDLAGSASVYRKYNEQLENYFYYYRNFISAKHRKGSVARDLTLHTRDYLEGLNERQDPSECAGLFMEVEHKGLRQAMYARNRTLHFNYIGKNVYGHHLRVYYFHDALAPQN